MNDELDDNEVVRNSFYQNNKILIWILIAIIAFILIFTLINNKKSTSEPINNDVHVTISPKEEVSVGVGNSIYLQAMVENIPDANIEWSSSNQDIIKVNNGTVVGVSLGKAEVIATYTKDGKEYKASKEVSVIEGNPSVALTDIAFSNGDLYMPVNSTYNLSLILTPTNARINKKVFDSSDPSVATVSSDGAVKSLKEGHTLVTVEVNDSFKKTIDVYIDKSYKKSEIILSPESISFNSKLLTIKVGDTVKLNYTTSPSVINYSYLDWSSSYNNIVSVDDEGNIKGNSVGSAVVTITSINGKRDDITINVTSDIINATDIVFQNETINMKTGENITITPTVVPDNATNKTLGFISSDSTIASVSIINDGRTGVISALKAGNVQIKVSSGNIEKVVNIYVTGDDVQKESNLPTTIVVRSDKNNLAYTYEEAKNIGVSGYATVTITLRAGVSKVKFCLNKYEESPCTPDNEMHVTGKISIPNGGMYVLRVIKYNYNNEVIKPVSGNFDKNGVLSYFINTSSNSDVKVKEYVVSGTYNSSTYAYAYPKNINSLVSIRLTSNTRNLLVCYTTNSSCTPNIKVINSYQITLNKTGLWRIFVIENDASGNKIGNTETYYAYVKSNDTNDNTNIINNNTDTKVSEYQNTVSNFDIAASNLKINSAVLIGKYLAVDVEANSNFNNTRFCYNIVSKGSNEFCNLDTTSINVPMHNGSSYFHPQEVLKTYAASFVGTNKKTLWFDIDGLDKLYDNNDTSKDVLFSFALEGNVNNKLVYSKPIRVRIHMTKREGNNSYWSSIFVK